MTTPVPRTPLQRAGLADAFLELTRNAEQDTTDQKEAA